VPTSWPSPMTRSRSTSTPSRRPRTPPSSRRPAAMPSRASSSSICVVAPTSHPPA